MNTSVFDEKNTDNIDYNGFILTYSILGLSYKYIKNEKNESNKTRFDT